MPPNVFEHASLLVQSALVKFPGFHSNWTFHPEYKPGVSVGGGGDLPKRYERLEETLASEAEYSFLNASLALLFWPRSLQKADVSPLTNPTALGIASA